MLSVVLAKGVLLWAPIVAVIGAVVITLLFLLIGVGVWEEDFYD